MGFKQIASRHLIQSSSLTSASGHNQCPPIAACFSPFFFTSRLAMSHHHDHCLLHAGVPRSLRKSLPSTRVFCFLSSLSLCASLFPIFLLNKLSPCLCALSFLFFTFLTSPVFSRSDPLSRASLVQVFEMFFSLLPRAEILKNWFFSFFFSRDVMSQPFLSLLCCNHLFLTWSPSLSLTSFPLLHAQHCPRCASIGALSPCQNRRTSYNPCQLVLCFAKSESHWTQNSATQNYRVGSSVIHAATHCPREQNRLVVLTSDW